MKTIKVTRDGRSLLIFDPCTLCLVYTNIDEGRGEGGGKKTVFMSHRKTLFCTMIMKKNVLGGYFKITRYIINITYDIIFC